MQQSSVYNDNDSDSLEGHEFVPDNRRSDSSSSAFDVMTVLNPQAGGC